MHIGKKIKSLMESSEVFNPSDFALALGKKNKQTYYDMIKREDINSGDLILVSKYFKVPITAFFDASLLPKTQLFIEQRIEALELKVKNLEQKHTN